MGKTDGPARCNARKMHSHFRCRILCRSDPRELHDQRWTRPSELRRSEHRRWHVCRHGEPVDRLTTWLGSFVEPKGKVPGVIARDTAPAAFSSWDQLLGAIASTAPVDLQGRARSIAQAALDPTLIGPPRSDTVIFGEQMVLDVGSITADVRTAGLTELGADAPTFVLALWTEDMMIRADAAWREMFGEQWERHRTSAQLDPWAAHEQFLLEVAKLSALDPVTSELVRLRGARAHACRLCQSRRNVTAIDLAGGPGLFEERDPAGVSEAQSLALQVVDTFVWQPTRWPSGLGDQLVESLGPAAGTELILDIIRNAANKIAVAFGMDAPQVETGVEYYEIDESTGELRYDVRPLRTGIA